MMKVHNNHIAHQWCSKSDRTSLIQLRRAKWTNERKKTQEG